jgi:hypothetical protein
VQAETSYSFTSLPETLILHLKRFAINYKLGREEKLGVNFPLTKSAQVSIGTVVYDLDAVLVHQGSRASSGHYFSYVKCAKTKTWFLVDDDVVRKVSTDRVFQETQAYLLFYSKATAPSSEKKPQHPIVVTKQAEVPEKVPQKVQVPEKVPQKANAPEKVPQKVSVPEQVPQPLKGAAPPASPACSEATVKSCVLSFSSKRGLGLLPRRVRKKMFSVSTKRLFDKLLSMRKAIRPKAKAAAVLEEKKEASLSPPQPQPGLASPPRTQPQSGFAEVFSFDTKWAKKREYADAWDEHLDRGRVKKVRNK